MKILITGVCGFVGMTIGTTLAKVLGRPNEIVGVDNLSRPGSERNRSILRKFGIKYVHGDVRCQSDFESIGSCDWVIDAAANPSVLAGADGRANSRQVIEHNLIGTLNILEYCKLRRAGLIMLSTSRVYSIEALSRIPVVPVDGAYRLENDQCGLGGLSREGISEDFSTAGSVSLYGATKLASERLAIEYGELFDFPVWINRCGVLAGAGQFGRADQGIVSFWINSYLRNRPLRYIGFSGLGYQVRDCLHPRDLVPLFLAQMAHRSRSEPKIVNIGGGIENAFSLVDLSNWCASRYGPKGIERESTLRRFDIPWLVMDSRRASERWNWRVETRLSAILEEVALHGEEHADWLDLCA